MQFKCAMTQKGNFLVWQVKPGTGRLVLGPCFYINPDGTLMRRVDDVAHEFGWAKTHWRPFEPKDLPEEFQASVEKMFTEPAPPKPEKEVKEVESSDNHGATHRPFNQPKDLVAPTEE